MHLQEEKHWEPARSDPRNQSSSLDGLGHDGGFHKSPMLSVAWESMAIISESDWDNTTSPEGGSAAASSSPTDAAIHIWSSAGAPKETTGNHRSDGPARSLGSSTGYGVEEGGISEDPLTVILRCPQQPATVDLSWHDEE